MHLGKLFAVLLVPLGFACVGMLAKLLSRPDGTPSPIRDDFAVGISMMLMTFSTIVADLLSAARALAPPALSSVVWLVGVVILLFALLSFERYFFWEVAPGGKRRRLLVGIVLPDAATLAIFIAYQATKP
jgi:hypothetical protein